MKKLNLTSGLLFATRLVLVAVFAVIFFGLTIAPANAATDGWHIKDDATGGECSVIGSWNVGNKTCTLSQDLSQGIIIDSDNIALDGNNHSVIGASPAIGINIGSKNHVTVKRMSIKNFYMGIQAINSWNDSFTDNTISGTYMGIRIYNNFRLLSSDTNYIGKNHISNNSAGISLYGPFTPSATTTTIDGNIIENGNVGILFEGAGSVVIINNVISGNRGGIRLDGPERDINSIYNNDFINNVTQVFKVAGDNVFNLVAPIGGNYWSNFDEPSEGCTDINSDNFCDFPYVFAGGQDSLPWTKQDGWLAPSNNPPTITLLGNNPIYLSVWDFFTDPSAIATDDIDGDLTAHIIVTGTVDTSVFGSYILTYTVTDSGGLTDVKTRTVTVTPAPAPSGGGGGSLSNNPPTISGLGQFDGATSISEGWILRHPYISSFSALVSDLDGDQIQLQVELRRFEELFTGIDDGGMFISDPVPSESDARVPAMLDGVRTAIQLSGGKYHWRARAVDSHDNKSAWQEFRIAGNVDFEIRTKIPVIIVPGIMGSYLFGIGDLEREEPYWPPLRDDILLPIVSPTIYKLSLDVGGHQTNDVMSAYSTIRTFGNTDILGSLIKTLVDNYGYVEGENLFEFPYDWRLDIAESAQSLQREIEKIKNQTGAQKIDIIAHSQGGLLSKFYIVNYGRGNVRKFIDIATPHLGAPKAFKTLMWGDDFGQKFSWFPTISQSLLESKIQSVSQNMPSVYQLLPSEKYFVNDPTYLDYQNYQYYFSNGDNIEIPRGPLSYDQSMQYLVSAGRNGNAFEWNRILHDSIDNWNGADYGVEETTNIVGCKNATIGKIFTFSKNTSGTLDERLKKGYAVHYVSGDGTVPLRSADYLSPVAQWKFYIPDAEHGELPSSGPALEIISAVLSSNTDALGILESGSKYGDKNSDKCRFDGKAVSFFSPVEVHVYDGEGRHTGIMPDGTIERNIPSVAYDILNDEKFIFLPTGRTYTITGKATGVGSFDARMETIQDDHITQALYFDEVPLTSLNTLIEIAADPSQSTTTISVDQNGDGTFEAIVLPTSVLNAEESGDTTAPITISTLVGPKLNVGMWYVGTTTVSLSATDDNAGILKTKYSLDGGLTWNIYTNSFIVIQEGTTTVEYFSVDRAGNNESLQSLVVYIDKTTPEIISEFSPITEQFVFSGVDTIDPNPNTLCTLTTCVVTDAAGHITQIDFDRQDKNIRHLLEFNALAYDGTRFDILSTSFVVNYKEDKKRVLRDFDHSFVVKKEERLRINYDRKKDQSTIFSKIKAEKQSKTVVSGMKTLRLTTQDGKIVASVK